MLIINHTLRHSAGGRETFTDHYQLADTLEEAKEIAQGLVTRLDDSLYCYSIAEILESSEPHWVDPKPDAAETLVDNAWGTDK